MEKDCLKPLSHGMLRNAYLRQIREKVVRFTDASIQYMDASISFKNMYLDQLRAIHVCTPLSPVRQ